MRQPILRIVDLVTDYITDSWQALTLQAVVKFREVTVLRLLMASDPVVGDVAIGIGGRLPLQDDLRRGVRGGDGVQRH